MNEAVCFHDQLKDKTQESFREAVISGLSASPKSLSPKFFYDHLGSELFEQICRQPEYYLTRVEERILVQALGEIAELAGPDSVLLELGSGASRKIRLLLETLRPSNYLGVDISREFLVESTRLLAADYPWLDVHAVWADFSRRMAMPQGLNGRRTLAFFPGSSIGNFEPTAAEAFLRDLRQMLPADSGLLIGVDLIKDEARLNAAYNDAAGLTAQFNLNLLERMRRELGAELDPSQFRHRAFYNAQAARIEMHLESKTRQSICLGDRGFEFASAETLHTENSCKYSIQGFRTMAQRAGFRPEAVWTDAEQLFSVHYLSSGSPVSH